MAELFKPISPSLTELKTGTPIIKQGNKYIVAGIGGDFIPGCVSTDTSDATATAADVPEGLVFYGADGKTTGTMPESEIFWGKVAPEGDWGIAVSSGYVKESIEELIPRILITVDDDTGSVTASAGYNSTEVTFQLDKSSGLSVSGATVSVGKGFVDEDKSVTINIGSVTYDADNNQVVVREGYVEDAVISIPAKDGFNTSDATVSSEDVASGVIFYGKEGRGIGSMPESTISTSKNTVSITTGRVSSDSVVTIEQGSVNVTNDIVVVSEGYVNSGNIQIEQGSVKQIADQIIVSKGYVNSAAIQIKKGSVKQVDASIVVSAGYVTQDDSFDLPISESYANADNTGVIVPVGYNVQEYVIETGGSGSSSGSFSLVQLSGYTPAREELNEKSAISVSGLGMFGSVEDGWYLDLTEANGTYNIMPGYEYKKGYARRYKHETKNYYFGGYEATADDWFSSHWYISDIKEGYGDSAALMYSSTEFPDGTKNWSNYNWGSMQATVTSTEIKLPALSNSASAVIVTSFDKETQTWNTGSSVSVSGALGNGIFASNGDEVIGECIGHSVSIPEVGLVRRFKNVDGHFIDTIWGTEMLPTGSIVFDKLGYSGINTAPFAKTHNSYFKVPNTLMTPLEGTVSAFFRCLAASGTNIIFGISHDGDINWNEGAGLQLAVDGSSFVHAFAVCGRVKSEGRISLGDWSMATMTYRLEFDTDRYYLRELNVYVNGKKSATATDIRNIGDLPFYDNMWAFGAQYYSSFIGQIDEACVWDRILSDSEISEMAKGTVTVEWDSPTTPYVQEQPVFYAPLADTKSTAETGQTLRMDGYGEGPQYAIDPFIRDGALWNYYTNANGGKEYDHLRAHGNFVDLYTSGSYTVCVDVYFDSWQNENYNSYRYNANVIDDRNSTTGIQLYNIAGSPDLYARYRGIDGSKVVTPETWTTIVARSTEGALELFTGGELNGSGTVNENAPFNGDGHQVCGPSIYPLNMAIRNIRIYNRALSDGEIAELSGSTAGAE